MGVRIWCLVWEGPGYRKDHQGCLDLMNGRCQSNKSGKTHTGPHDAEGPRVVMLSEDFSFTLAAIKLEEAL